MSGQWLKPEAQGTWSPQQRAMIDQYTARLTEVLGGLVAETARHFQEDGCKDVAVCPGDAVTHYIADLPGDQAKALLIGAVCDLGGFLTVVKAGHFTQENLLAHFDKMQVLREEIGGCDG